MYLKEYDVAYNNIIACAEPKKKTRFRSNKICNLSEHMYKFKFNFLV